MTLATGYGILAMLLLIAAVGFWLAWAIGTAITYGLLIFRYKWGKPIKQKP